MKLTPFLTPFREYKRFEVAIGIVAAIFVGVLWILPPYVFWSPDEGGKFLQMRTGQADDPSAYCIPYLGHVQDSEHRFYPTRTMYPQPSANGTVTFGWPPLFPLLSFLPYRAFGMRGIYFLPALAGILTVLMAGLTAQRLQPGSWPLVVYGLALAGPILFYGVLFWEHTLAVCAGLAAVYLGLFTLGEGSPAARCGKAGAMLGLLALSANLRFEMAILPVALFLVAGGFAFMHRRELRAQCHIAFPRLRQLLSVSAMALVAVALVVVLELWFRGHFRFPFYAANMMRTALSRLEDAELWWTIPAFVAGVLVNTSEEAGVPLAETWVWMGMLGLGLCALSCAPLGRQRFWLWLIGAAALLWVSWEAVTMPDRYRAVHSLLLPAPFLVLALLPLSRQAARNPVRIFLESLTVIYFCLYLLLAFMINGVQGGAEWGNRYGLVLYPLLAILAGVRYQTFLTSPETRLGRKTVVQLLACGLLALGLLFTVRGVGEIRHTKRDMSAYSQEIRANEGAVVTDIWWMPAALAPTFVDREFYTLAASDELCPWVERVGRSAKRFLFVSYGAGPTDEATLDAWRLHLVESKTINGMQFFRYEVLRL